MRVALFNWRGPDSPKGGGAEHATDILASGLAARGHSVVWFTSACRGRPASEKRNGYTIQRAGSEVTCRFHAALWLVRNRESVDVVVDEVNTLPFFSPFVTRERVILWLHQLAREVWTAEAPPVIGSIGRFTERQMLAVYSTTPVITGAASSARSFREIGLRGAVRIVEYPLPQPADRPSEPTRNRVGYVGRIARSKRIDHIIHAIAQVRRTIPDVQLSIVGRGEPPEIRRLDSLIRRLHLEDSVRMHGRVSLEERDALMRTFDVLCMASMREGWGLVVSEAARFGVPSVVYPVAGLVDSVQNGTTGIVVSSERPPDLAAGLMQVLSNRALRDQLGRAAMRYIEEFTEDRFVDRFERILLERAD